MGSTSPFFVVGMMGSGKTTVGRALAEQRGVVFVDLDRRIERIAGQQVADLFARGEQEFRQHETIALRSLTDEPGFSGSGAIVATGGGVVLSAQNRMLMAHVGRRCYLNVELDTLVARLSQPSEAARRPLLAGGDLRATLHEIKEAREQYYREAELVVDGAAPVAEVVRRICDALED